MSSNQDPLNERAIPLRPLNIHVLSHGSNYAIVEIVRTMCLGCIKVVREDEVETHPGMLDIISSSHYGYDATKHYRTIVTDEFMWVA